MIVWERGENDIYFSRTNDTVWSQPSPLGIGQFGGRTPYVTIADTLFGAVWENGGRILFSEYRNSAWLIPVLLTTPNDTANFLPQVKYFYSGNPYRYRPIVLWERRKRVSQDREIVWVTRTDSGWTLPDTVTSAGDCRHARFVSQTHPGSILISFESNRLGPYCIFGAWSSLGAAWSVEQQPISSNIAGWQQTSASFTLFPVITTSPSEPQAIRYTAGTWRIARDTGEDSIGLVERSLYSLNVRSGGNGEDRNPVLSTGVNNLGPVRVWSVWQNNAGGTWKLFGSYADIILDDVKESGVVNAFQLEQNYPNPFNPTTTIRFTIPVGTGHAPSLLKVYDILGREVTTLVNEAKEPGDHQITFNAEGLSSGVYLYKLQVGNFVAVRKLIVLR
ncbi:MAG: T9SS type A sorting domain-containing protein [Ignavibacteriae bacterium]|nr:T9SS type A sorting domain-containing protein [Ignavibacteriota bacterium]